MVCLTLVYVFKFLELQSRGSFLREDILTALTANQGNLDAAYVELSKAQLKPFLMRIWGPPSGQDNEALPPPPPSLKSSVLDLQVHLPQAEKKVLSQTPDVESTNNQSLTDQSMSGISSKSEPEPLVELQVLEKVPAPSLQQQEVKVKNEDGEG